MRAFTIRLLALAAVVLSQAPAFAAETILMGTTGRGSAQQWPIFIAQQKGYFAENGLTVDLVAAQSSAAIIQQLTAGSVNLASGGLADPLRAIDKGAPVTLLRVETQVPPYSVYGKPALKSLKDLKGKLISIGGVKDITRIYLERMMAPNGVKPDEYDLVFAGTAAARFAALASGAVDATILVPPFSFQAESAGFSNLGALSDYVKDMPFTGYAANTAWAKSHKPALVAFLKGVAKGVDFFNDPAHRTESIDILVKESGSARDLIEKSYDYYLKIKIFDRVGLVEGSQVKVLAEAMKSLGDLEGSTDVSRFVDPEIVELAKYKSAGFLTDMTLGKNPALIVVDVTFAFTGYEGQTLEESIASFGSACGPVSWEAMPKIVKLIAMFRERGLPIVFTNSAPANTPFAGKATKSKRTKAPPKGANDFPEAITPRAGEWVLGKTRASAFFQTPLTSYLVQQHVDTLVFCGVSTSGCVRASVVDGFSHGFSTFVVDECCFDRSPFAHAANLFDMEAKYASVVSLDELARLMPAAPATKAA